MYRVLRKYMHLRNIILSAFGRVYELFRKIMYVSYNLSSDYMDRDIRMIVILMFESNCVREFEERTGNFRCESETQTGLLLLNLCYLLYFFFL